MERLILIVTLLLFAQCNAPENLPGPAAPSKNTQATDEASVTESLEIPHMLDSSVHRVLKSASIFWLTEESVLTSWPKHLKGPILSTICKDEAKTADCTPGNFNVINLNDSLDLIVDYSPSRSGSAGTLYYVYNKISRKFLSRHIGTVYGIVKSEGFIGFIYHFRYMGEKDYNQSYDCLEEIKGEQVITRAILTPNEFTTLSEQRKDFELYKSKYFTTEVD